MRVCVCMCFIDLITLIKYTLLSQQLNHQQFLLVESDLLLGFVLIGSFTQKNNSQKENLQVNSNYIM